MTEAKRSLDDLRQELDSIDRGIHELIIRRGALAGEISAIKERDSIERIRPGREAVILRNLAARHDGVFPVAAVLRIWRELIASITRLELADYAVAVFVEDGPGWDMARDQFGSTTRMLPCDDAEAALAAVTARKTTLGVVPFPAEGTGGWWAALAAPGAPKVVYRLPFAGPWNARPAAALAFGYITPEPSGDDLSLLVVETTDPSGPEAVFAARGLTPECIVADPGQDRRRLVEVPGFWATDDGKLAEITADPAITSLAVVGVYPRPMPGVGQGITGLETGGDGT